MLLWALVICPQGSFRISAKACQLEMTLLPHHLWTTVFVSIWAGWLGWIYGYLIDSMKMFSSGNVSHAGTVFFFF